MEQNTKHKKVHQGLAFRAITILYASNQRKQLTPAPAGAAMPDAHTYQSIGAKTGAGNGASPLTPPCLHTLGMLKASVPNPLLLGLCLLNNGER
jgi:hypothetical protein